MYILLLLLSIYSIVNTQDLYCITTQEIFGKFEEYLDIKRVVQQDSFSDIVPAIVIGGGPAGWSALFAFAQAKIYALGFAGEQPGGQLVQASVVTNWPGILRASGADIMEQFQHQVESWGGQMVYDTIEEVDFSQWPRVVKTGSGQVLRTFAVVIATGMAAKKLGVPGEDEYWGRGVAKCALCDGPSLKDPDKDPDKDVVVVGGGNSAVEQTLQLLPYAKTITILVRSNRMRALPTSLDRLKEYIQTGKVTIKNNQEIKKIIGDGTRVTGIELVDIATGEEFYRPIDAVFLAIGYNPRSELFKNWLKLDRHGFIVVEQYTQQTSVPGVFAAGDVTNPIGQVRIAVGEGQQAGLRAIDFLRDHGYSESVAEQLATCYFKYSLELMK